MMLSIATLHAVDYYTDAATEAFGYYGGKDGAGEVDPPGHWTGALARQYFGTDASVRREDFAALFFGIDPQSGRSLTKSADPLGFACWQAEQIAADPARTADERRTARERAGELRRQIKARESKDGWRGHRAGIDLTFSAPKDFSLLVAAADPDERQRLLAAWRRSVEATLTDAEQRYAKTRLRDPAGRLTKERIAGAAIAMFEHIAARPVGDQPPDPDAHLHCVMFSPVLCHDAATRALFSNDLRLNLKVLDAEARARLAQELAGMGYAVTEDRQKHCTSFHLPGISEAERIRYSKRRGEIVAGLTAGQFQSSAVAAIGTRQGKGDWSRADALAAWRADFASHGLTVERIRQAPPPDERPPRTDAEILADLLSMQSYFSARELRQALWEEAQFVRLPAGTDLGHWIDARANQLLQSPDLLEAQLPDGSTASRLRSATGDEEPIFTTRSLLRREIALDAAVNALGQTQRHAVGWAEASRIVAAQERRKTAEAQAKATAAGQPLPEDFRWAYRDDQKAAIAQVLAGPDVGFIQAYAGTGKTTAAAAMIEVWRAQGKQVIALAPSNKAAGQLTEDCQLTGEGVALTVDAFLRSKARDGVDADTVLFVDEASMLGFDNAEALVNLARERGCKIVFQSDKEQLPSVARGRFFANCIEQRLGTEAAELTVITRQREAWARVATNAAARGDFATTMGLLDQHDLIHTEGTDEAVLDRIARDHLADPRAVDQKLIVASRNADVAALNARIRQALVEGGLISGGVPCLAGKERRQSMLIGVGDRLIFTDTLKDGRRKLAVNGAIGTVQTVETTDGSVRVRVLLDGQRDPVVFDTRDFAAFQHAYAISIHKSQGATVESCRYRHLHADGENSALILPSLPETSGDFATVRRYGVPGLSETQCGGVTGSEASGGVVAETVGFFGINSGAAEKAAAIRAAHAAAAETMEARLAVLAGRIADGSLDGAQAEYVAAIQAYQDTLADAATAQLGDQAYFERLAENAAQEGWVLAGSFFMRFAALQDAVLKAIADAPTAMPVEKAPELMAADMNRYYAALQGAVHDPTKTGIDNQLLADKEREDSETGLVMSAINAVFNKINEGSTAGFNFITEADIDQHPLVVASAAGHTMIGWGLALAVASVIAAKVGGTTIALVLGGFVMALLAGGASLAYLLPMIPFILWSAACASWMLILIEAVLGAPLWAVAHLNPNGEELAGSARAGYMLILEMMLKPVLMVFGLAFAVLVSLPLGILINRVFYSTFSLAQGGFVGFVGMLAAVGIYSALMLSMMKWTFSFIHKVPDQIFKWMGGGHGSGLAEASSAAASAEHQSGAVVGTVGGAVAGAMTSRINQLSQKVAQTEERKQLGGPDQAGGAEPGASGVAAGDPPVQSMEAKVAGQLGEAKAAQEGEAEAVAESAFGSAPSGHRDNGAA